MNVTSSPFLLTINLIIITPHLNNYNSPCHLGSIFGIIEKCVLCNPYSTQYSTQNSHCPIIASSIKFNILTVAQEHSPSHQTLPIMGSTPDPLRLFLKHTAHVLTTKFPICFILYPKFPPHYSQSSQIHECLYRWDFLREFSCCFQNGKHSTTTAH